LRLRKFVENPANAGLTCISYGVFGSLTRHWDAGF